MKKRQLQLLQALQALQNGDRIPAMVLLGVPAQNLRMAASSLTTDQILNFLAPIGLCLASCRPSAHSLLPIDVSKPGPDPALTLYLNKDLHWLNLPVFYDPEDWEFLWKWGKWLIPIPDLEIED